MTAWNRCLKVLAAPAAVLAVAVAFPPMAMAKEKEPAAEAQGPQANYSKEFRKLGAPVQALVNEKKWAEVLAALPQFASLPAPTPDDLKAIATWRLQAAQGAIIGLLRPAQHRPATAGAQALLGRPEGIATAGLHQRQPAQVDAGGLPGLGIRDMWRRHQYHAFGAGGQPCQGGPEQTQLAQASGRDENFAECGLGPAATGQDPVQGVETGGLVAASRQRAGLSLPDPPFVEQGIEGYDGAHQPCPLAEEKNGSPGAGLPKGPGTIIKAIRGNPKITVFIYSRSQRLSTVNSEKTEGLQKHETPQASRPSVISRSDYPSARPGAPTACARSWRPSPARRQRRSRRR